MNCHLLFRSASVIGNRKANDRKLILENGEPEAENQFHERPIHERSAKPSSRTSFREAELLVVRDYHLVFQKEIKRQRKQTSKRKTTRVWWLVKRQLAPKLWFFFLLFNGRLASLCRWRFACAIFISSQLPVFPKLKIRSPKTGSWAPSLAAGAYLCEAKRSVG